LGAGGCGRGWWWGRRLLVMVMVIAGHWLVVVVVTKNAALKRWCAECWLAWQQVRCSHPVTDGISRPIAEIIPLVSVWSSPKGLPIANAF
jgi:hypothetical protein